MMGKQSKKKPSKHKTISTLNRPSENIINEPIMSEKKNDVGLTDKLSRIFYGWMKRRKSALILSFRADQFEIKGLICEGTFGKVLTAINTDNHLMAAAKIEDIDTRCPQLLTEYKIYDKLGCENPGFIKIYYYGPCVKSIYNVLIMELLGPDLDDLFVYCNEKFSHKTVLMIAVQTLNLIKHVHSRNIIYRDIKPENFCIGHKYQNKERILHIIDFGLAKIVEPTVASVAKGEEVIYDYLIGTARYMSINAHFAFEQSQRDDLESLGYMYAYFLKGRLPWMGLSKVGNIVDHYRHIATLKASIKPEDLIGDYWEFVDYLKYVKNLEYMEEPNYDYLISLMTTALRSKRFSNDSNFDWAVIMNQKYLNKALEIDPDD